MYTVSQRAIEVIMVKCFHLCMNWNYLPCLYGVCCDIVFTVAITNNANNVDPIMCLSRSRILKIVGFAFWIWRILSKLGIILQSAFELLMHCRAKMLIMKAFRNNGLVVHMAAWLLNLAYALLVSHWAVGPTQIKTLWSSGDCDSLYSVNNYGVLVGIQHLTWVVILWLWRCYTRLSHVGYNRHQA